MVSETQCSTGHDQGSHVSLTFLSRDNSGAVRLRHGWIDDANGPLYNAFHRGPDLRYTRKSNRKLGAGLDRTVLRRYTDGGWQCNKRLNHVC